MGLTKAEIFNASQNEISSICKVLGHPARVAILEYISIQNSCICNDLVSEIGLAQATISQHLRELKNIGLLQGEIEGKSVCYCINHDKWNSMKALMTNFLNQDISITNNCC